MVKQTKGNNNILLYVIIGLLAVIAILGFFLGKNFNNTGNTGSVQGKNVEIMVIDDKRCIECQTDGILSQLKLLPALTNVEIEEKDFSDEGISEYLRENNINALPAIIFNHNMVDSNINSYLTKLPNDSYSLQVGANFNPFANRSDRGFLVLEKEKRDEILQDAHIDGSKEASITWIEYSDLECPFCAKLHNSGTPKELKAKYGDKLNISFQHFPLDFHANALPGAQIIECLGEQKGSEAFYALVEKSFSQENSKKSFLIDEAVKLGAGEDSLKECLSSGKYKDKALGQQKTGSEVFGITGTPGNVLLNNNTGEYSVISGAYPTSAFESIIDSLLE